LKKSKKTDQKSSNKKRVSGYWVFRQPKTGKAPVTYFVKSYKRKKPAKPVKHRKKPVAPPQPTQPPPVLPGVLVRYTFKLEMLVPYDYKYTVSFARDPSVARNVQVIQFYHTQFCTTVKEATLDLQEKVEIIKTFGPVLFLEIRLYRVAGIGRTSDMDWHLMQTYNEPEDVPGFKRR